MATSRDVLLDTVSPLTGRAVRLLRDPSDGRRLTQHAQDVTPVLREAQLGRDMHQAGIARPHITNPAGMVRVACVPTIIVEELKRQGIWQDRQKMLAWLSDPANRAWRTDDGRRLA